MYFIDFCEYTISFFWIWPGEDITTLFTGLKQHAASKISPVEHLFSHVVWAPSLYLSDVFLFPSPTSIYSSL